MMNGKVEYAIMHGQEGNFVINSTSGIITTAGALDRETKDSYTVNINAAILRFYRVGLGGEGGVLV